MDIGEIIKAPFKDEKWITKSLVMGLFLLIPIAGAFNAMGYIKACYNARKAGETDLPEAKLAYIGDGWWLFVSILPAVGALLLVAILMAVGAGIAAKIARPLASIFAIATPLIMLVLGLALAVASPAIFYLHIVKGERWASAKVGDIIALIKVNPNAYLMLWLMFFIANIIGGAGQIACGIGVLVTMPLAYAMQGFALCDHEKAQTPAA